ncbi:hypothetical protein [Amycolatopsis thermophila]|uniref:Uncharacterized protein n=1 Tax=Amycolatopsis thermophila TaxID=206084 RepID=A0ABU0EMY1_9PSEU|nr:hypothetical protein [Amycolatopsis thermophila]MDQ0376592.1 hypothetical protein [Amycolatopsis thermophila]
MTTHDEQRVELARDLDTAVNTVPWERDDLARYLVEQGWRKQGAADPELPQRVADDIENLLHEFDGVAVKRIIADEIVNRIVWRYLGQRAAADDTAGSRAEPDRVRAERDAFVKAGRALVREHDWLKGQRDDLQARNDAARGIAEEMRSQLVNGPELNDVLRILAALGGGGDLSGGLGVDQPNPPNPPAGTRVKVTARQWRGWTGELVEARDAEAAERWPFWFLPDNGHARIGLRREEFVVCPASETSGPQEGQRR